MHRAISLDVCDYTNTLVCNLYDSANDIAGQATDVIVHTERNGYKELKFSLPSVTEDGEKNYRLDWLITDYKIRLRTVTKEDDGYTKNTEIDWFLLSENKVVHNNFSMNYDITATHVSQLLNTKNLGLEFSDEEGNNTGTIKQIAAAILEGTGWHLGYVAQFLEEDKYITSGETKEKVRSFTASAKTGAFKMMNDLCEMFDAKPIYHGEGTYTDDEGQEQIGRTVDIIPMNPFSKDLSEGSVPQEVLEGEGVLALYYDKNVRNITRTLSSDHLVSVLSAYGSFGDVATGMVSLQTCQHAEMTFGSLPAGAYHFEYLDGQYYFTTDKATTGLKWSYLDFISRTYVFDGTNLFKVTKDAPSSYTTITGNVEFVKNYLSFIMDFTYYQKIGLLTDEHLLEIAKLQWNLPQKYLEVQNASLALSEKKSELTETASAGNGFLMFDIQSMNMNKGNVRLKLKLTDEYPDGVIYRSDYDEAKRNYFSWTPATGITSSGRAISSRGAVFYIVHNTNPTTWEKAYLKAVGTTTADYYRDDFNNIYNLTTERHYDHKSYDAADPGGSVFPTSGTANIIYVADDTKKMYVWNNENYTQIKASSYYYGTNDFPYPETVTLWTTKNGAWTSGDKVYMFSSDSIAGLFGPREDQLVGNKEEIQKVTKSAGTVEHPVTFINQGDSIPTITGIEDDGYAWYYLSYTNRYDFGDLYFCYKAAGDTAWKKVYISDNSNDVDEIPVISGYGYYYSKRRKLIYRATETEQGQMYIRLDNTYNEQEVKKAFASVIISCYKHEELSKGVREKYNYSGVSKSLKGNFAFKGEYDLYYLFSTGTTVIPNSRNVYYDTKTNKVWIDNDQDHILNSVVYRSDSLTFPKSNDIEGLYFTEGDYDPETQVLKPAGEKLYSKVSVYENTTYEYSLPQDSILICLDKKGAVLLEVTASPFTTPAHTENVAIVCPEKPDETCYLHVQNYSSIFYISNIGYTILNCTGGGERLGMVYLMNKFISLSHEVYQVQLPLLQAAQKEITDTITKFSNDLGDMYREGFWQETKYVEGDEQRLYSDALDNLKEISHPEATYDISYLDLYGSDNNLTATVDEDWANVDITYAAHLVDMDIDTNKWAYIDSIDKCYDQPWKTEITVNTKLSMIGQQSFTDVLAKIAEVANEVKAKQTVYDRAKVIGSAGQFAADRLEGLIQANKVYLLGGTSNWYTDEKGNIIFEAADGNSIMMLTGRGLMVSNERDKDGDWLWRTAISGLGINADTIAAGEFSAKHIIAGTITTDKLSSAVGQELEISSNKALAIYATSDGERPAGSLLTMHPNESDSWIAIAAATETEPAYIAVKSGGIVSIEAGSKLELLSADQLFIGVDKTLKDELDESIIETVRVYKNGTSNSTAPTLSGSVYPTFGTKDTSWRENQQGVTTTNKYLWSRPRYKNGLGEYAYGSALYEGELSNKVATDHNEYMRTSTNVAPSATDSSWSTSIPTKENNSNLDYLWVCDAVTNTNGTTGRFNIRRETGLESMTNATLTALNIASGKVAVPKVDSTGISIADNLLQVKSTGRLDVIGNGSVNIGTSSSNSAVVLNKDGISIASGADIAIASGGHLVLTSGDDLFIGNNTTINDLFGNIQNEIDTNDNNSVVECVRVYALSSSSSTAPTSGWSENVPATTSTNKWLWSCTRTKKKVGNYSYGTAICEGYLSTKLDDIHSEYIRTATTTQPSSTASGWSTSIPAPTYNSSGVETNPYVWSCTATKNTTDSDYIRTNIHREEGLESLSGAAIKAINIASGLEKVPWVKTTGIEIKGNSMSISAVDAMTIAANSSLVIQNASGNNKITLDGNGISIGTGANLAIASGGKLTITSGDQLFIGTNTTINDIFDGIHDDIDNVDDNIIVETVRVYALNTSSSTAPTTGWSENVPAVYGNENKYLWSCTRSQKKSGDYTYGTKICEGLLVNKVADVHTEYIRTAAETPAPSATDDNWSTSIPKPTYNSSHVQTNKYVWSCTATKNKDTDSFVRTDIHREYGLEDFSGAVIQAANIANGYESVPWVETTGFKIQGNSMTISAVDAMTIGANNSLVIQNASGNNKITLDGSGVSIGSGADIGIVAGGTVTIGKGKNPFNIGANNSNAWIYNGMSTLASTSNGIYLGTDGIALGGGKFKVTNAGVLTATSADIKGTINATGGYIGGFTITENEIKSGDDLFHIKFFETHTDNTGVLYVGASTPSTAPFAVAYGGKMKATNATIEGKVTAKEGYIGTEAAGFKINSSYIANPSTKTTYNSTVEGVYIGTDGIGLGANKFTVTKAGVLTAKDANISGTITATSGSIGGWHIGPNYIGNVAGTYGNSSIALRSDATGTDLAIWAGATQASSNIPFYVMANGKMKATNAEISGTITATSGKIGGWYIGSDWIGNNGVTYGNCTIGLRSGATGDNIAIWAGHDFTATPPFSVLADGTVIITQLRVLNPETGLTENVNLYRNFTPASSVKVSDVSVTWNQSGSSGRVYCNITVSLSNNKSFGFGPYYAP